MRIALCSIATLFFFAGCAQLVTKTYKPKRGGVVKYNTGWFLAEKNRAKAIKLAEEHCHPRKISILSEDSRSEFTGQSRTRGEQKGNSYESTTSQSKENSIYIRFNCTK